MKTIYLREKAGSRFVKSIALVLLLLFSSAKMFSQCPTVPGNPANYGVNSWIGYVYSGLDANNPPQNAFATTYRGYITQAEQFDYNIGAAAPTASTVCGSYPDSFSIRYRMRKNFTAGYYSVTLGGDDGVRLSIDGGATWAMSDWNYHSYQTTTATLYLSGATDLVLESYDQGGEYRVSFSYTMCTDPSTAPTSITGNTDLCGATGTTLTATGGFAAPNSTYQWGTGTTVGNNIIAGQTSQSITVNPATTTTYWVRRLNPAPCAMTTPGITQQVTVTPVSTAPTTISGTTSICAGSSTTLTASGGTLAAGSVYEWGTGNVGDNVISGQTGASITVTPATTTTYWVRRVNSGNCGRTAGISAVVTVTAITGDQVSYGADSWIGYVYSGIDSANPPATPFTTTVYRGYITQPEQFDYNLGSAAISGANICGTYPSNFAIRFKMTKNWTPGYYKFTAGGDDGYRFSMDGGATWILSNWADHSYTSSTTASIYLSGNANFVIEFYERGGDTRVTFSYTACTDISTAPTSISGTTAICSGSSTTLTANGGYAGAYATYQWGTGTTVGNNIINGQTAVSITVSPTANTTYWVRRVDGTPCNLTTDGVTQLVTVSNTSTAPTSVSGTNTICPGASTTLTAQGGALAAGGAYEWGTGTTVGSNVISGATTVSISVSPTTTTTYWVRRTSAAPCPSTNGVTVTVTVRDISTAPTSISGTNSLCNTNGGVTLSADGGTAATGATYQWGTGSTIGSNVIAGTGQTLFVNPTVTTVYWVRRYDSACAAYTAGVTVTVYKGSTGPNSISGASTICANTSTVLTAQGGTLGTGSVYQWGTGNVAGTNVIAGQTASTITVTPSATTTYWVRLVDQGTCPGTAAVFYTVNTYVAPTAVTSVTGPTTLCSGAGGGNLTANGASMGSNGQYQWGTGTVGSNVFANYSPVYINPTTTTTYWVRTYDPTCGTYTAAVTYTVTVSTPSTQPSTITATNTTVCSGASVTLTASGGTSGTGSVYAWGTGYTVGNNVIAGETGASITVNPTAQTVYWVRRVDPAPCNTQTQGPTIVINVTTTSTAPTGFTATSPICSGTATTLTVSGATLGSSGQYQFGTGNTAGTNVIATQTGNTYSVSPTATTTYWVRTIDSSCSMTSAALYFTVTVNTPSTAPTGISGTTTICAGASTTLTATGGVLGTGGAYQWGTGATVGNNIISGQTAVSITVSPTANTTYWVRRVDGTPCNTTTGGVTVTVNVTTLSTAPTGFTATSPICSGTATTLTATGATLGSGGQYQFGTGNTAGTNVIATQTASTYNVSPTTTTTYWVRTIDSSCSATSTALYFTVTINTASTAPTGISGTTAICAGASTTLTATGGVLGTGGSYVWGTGATVGNNIITTETGVSITVSPTTTTTYWVRRKDGAPCNTTTGGVTVAVTVTAVATAPTSITGAPTAAACAGTSYTLTATGGTGTTYQWGTGTVGTNVIAGQTGASISVSPTVTTTYWVRRVQTGSCSGYTAGATTTISITTPPGTPTVFGANQWNVYGYSTGDITLASAVYAGYYVSTDLAIDTQNGTNSWNNNLSPSASAGWNGCPVPNDNFTFAYKRKGFPCGTYTLAMVNWDDEVRVYINGTLVFSCDSWSGSGACAAASGSFNLSANSEIEVRVREYGGGANVKLNITKTDVASTAPTAISGSNTSCNGAAVVLTATGGTTGTNGVYEWGTGTTVGSNVISGATTASITVNPTANTTYWVRRNDALCGVATAGVTFTVTVSAGTVAGTLACPSTVICRNTMPQSITLSGNTGSVVKWQYADDSNFTVNVHDIANTTTTLASAQIGNVPSTRYFRAVVQNGSCAIANTSPAVVTVPAAVTYNGTWSGTPTLLTPVIISANLNLTANINACACQITNSATLTVQPNVTLVVQREITLDNGAKLTVESSGSVVQIDDDAVNSGTATVKRNSAPMKGYDFTYWSSPVQGMTLYNFSPNTRFDKYFSFDPIVNNWVTHMNGAATMVPGRGYIVRAPADWSVTNATQGVYNGVFAGVMNTGIVNAPFSKGAGTSNLIGNPYPSAIDIDLFLTDPANANLVNGTIYLWTHNTAVSSSIPGNTQYNYTADDYATYNLTGGVKTASAAISGGVEPTGKVASGQSFFIDAKAGLANGSYTATFRNSMRIAGQNGQFFRSANADATSTVQTVGLEKHRAWINMHNNDGAYTEMLVGYIESATNGMDRLFDGELFNGGNFVSLYTLVGTTQLAVQGRALPFNVEDVVPVGYTSSVAGSFTIELEHFDGLFANQIVYLVDKTDNSYHNISQSGYTFTTTTGIFDNRFELRFQTPGQLGVGDHTPTENSVYIIKHDKHVEVSSGNYNMTDVQIFDLTGKKVYDQKDINATLFSTKDLNMAAQVLIVKVTLDNDAVVTKKVIMY